MENKQVVNEVVENQVEGQGQNQSNKEEKKFNENLKKLEAILQGNALFKPNRVSQDSVSSIVEELTKERQEQARFNFKKDLSDILDKKFQLDTEIKKLRQELAKKEEEKYKEFNNAINGIFSKVEDVQAMIASYTKTLENLK